MDAVGLYPNIPRDEGLCALRKRLESRKQKHVSTDTIIDLVEVVLKITCLHSEKRHLSKNGGTAIVTKLARPYSILFMAELEEEMMKNSEYKRYLWRYIGKHFSCGNMLRIN